MMVLDPLYYFLSLILVVTSLKHFFTYKSNYLTFSWFIHVNYLRVINKRLSEVG